MIKRVVVASTNFRLAYKVQLAISDNYKYNHKFPIDEILDADVVVTTIDEYYIIQHTKKLILNWNFSISKIKSKLIKSLFDSKMKACTIGIDPGKAIGISIIYLGVLLNTSVFNRLDKMLIWIKGMLKEIDYDTLLIKIGNGGGEIQTKIIDAIVNQYKGDVIIEKVNENNTSIRESKNKSIHEEAAIRIANRNGTVQ